MSVEGRVDTLVQSGNFVFLDIYSSLQEIVVAKGLVTTSAYAKVADSKWSFVAVKVEFCNHGRGEVHRSGAGLLQEQHILSTMDGREYFARRRPVDCDRRE